MYCPVRCLIVVFGPVWQCDELDGEEEAAYFDVHWFAACYCLP